MLSTCSLRAVVFQTSCATSHRHSLKRMHDTSVRSLEEPLPPAFHEVQLRLWEQTFQVSTSAAGYWSADVGMLLGLRPKLFLSGPTVAPQYTLAALTWRSSVSGKILHHTSRARLGVTSHDL